MKTALWSPSGCARKIYFWTWFDSETYLWFKLHKSSHAAAVCDANMMHSIHYRSKPLPTFMHSLFEDEKRNRLDACFIFVYMCQYRLLSVRRGGGGCYAVYVYSFCSIWRREGKTETFPSLVPLVFDFFQSRREAYTRGGIKGYNISGTNQFQSSGTRQKIETNTKKSDAKMGKKLETNFQVDEL